jgi:hypothetical protein
MDDERNDRENKKIRLDAAKKTIAKLEGEKNKQQFMG